MRCPRCQSLAAEGSWRSRVRRGQRVIWIRLCCWRCPACTTSAGPFLFLSPELEDRNDAVTAAAWLQTFDQPIPPALVGTRLRRRMRTPQGRARVAAAFARVLETQITKEKP